MDSKIQKLIGRIFDEMKHEIWENGDCIKFEGEDMEMSVVVYNSGAGEIARYDVIDYVNE